MLWTLSCRKFEVALDLGCGRGHVSKHILGDMVGILYQTDLAEHVLVQYLLRNIQKVNNYVDSSKFETAHILCIIPRLRVKLLQKCQLKRFTQMRNIYHLLTTAWIWLSVASGSTQ